MLWTAKSRQRREISCMILSILALLGLQCFPFPSQASQADASVEHHREVVHINLPDHWDGMPPEGFTLHSAFRGLVPNYSYTAKLVAKLVDPEEEAEEYDEEVEDFVEISRLIAEERVEVSSAEMGKEKLLHFEVPEQPRSMDCILELQLWKSVDGENFLVDSAVVDAFRRRRNRDKTFIYLVHHRECIDLSHLWSDDAAVVLLVRGERQGYSCSDAIYEPNATDFQVRDLLLSEMNTRYPIEGNRFLYIFFVDGSAELTECGNYGQNSGDAWRTFERYLLDWEPAVGVPSLRGSYERQVDLGPHGPAQAEFQCARDLDRVITAYHFDALQFLFPLYQRFSANSTRYAMALQSAISMAAYHQHAIQFNALCVKLGQDEEKHGLVTSYPGMSHLTWIAPIFRGMDYFLRLPIRQSMLTSCFPSKYSGKGYDIRRAQGDILDKCHPYYVHISFGKEITRLCSGNGTIYDSGLELRFPLYIMQAAQELARIEDDVGCAHSSNTESDIPRAADLNEKCVLTLPLSQFAAEPRAGMSMSSRNIPQDDQLQGMQGSKPYHHPEGGLSSAYMHKQFLYLVQHDVCLDLSYLKSDNSEVILGVWREPPGQKCTGAIYSPNTTLVQGRNRLFKEAERRYPDNKFMYIVIMDGDNQLTIKPGYGYDDDDPWRTFERLLLEWEPAVGVPHFDVDNPIPVAEVQCAFNFDQIIVAYHAEAVPLLLPYEERFDNISWWYCGSVQNALCAAAYRHHILQFNSLKVSSYVGGGGTVGTPYRRGMNFVQPLAWTASSFLQLDLLLAIPWANPLPRSASDPVRSGPPISPMKKSPNVRYDDLHILGSVFDPCHIYFKDKVFGKQCVSGAFIKPSLRNWMLPHVQELSRRVQDTQVRVAHLFDEDDVHTADLDALADKLQALSDVLDSLL